MRAGTTTALLVLGLAAAGIALATAVARVPQAQAQAQAQATQPAPPAAPAKPVTSAPLAAPKMAPKVASEAQTIALPVGKVEVVQLPAPARDVVVANPNIADVIVHTPTQVYIVGKAIGETNIFFVAANGRITHHVVARVEMDLGPARAAIQVLLANESIEIKAVNDSIVLSGTVRSGKSSADASAVVRRFVKEDVNVVNMIRIIEDQQVLLQVRVAEVQRNVLKNLGFQMDFNRVIGGDRFSLTSLIPDQERGALGALVVNDLGLGRGVFSALERQGLIKTLAEPTLTAISGEPASFLAGGTVPIVTGVDQNGNPVVSQKEVGVSLSFTPVVLANDQISLRIATEVSRRDRANRVALRIGANDVQIEGLSIRRAGSTVTLPSGGNLMIAGLLQEDEFNDIDSTPGFKDLPVLGALFRSTRFQKFQSELVVVVTAYLVRPVDGKQKLAMPTDGFAPASDIDMYLMGRLHSQYSKKKDRQQIPMLRGPFGYIME